MGETEKELIWLVEPEELAEIPYVRESVCYRRSRTGSVKRHDNNSQFRVIGYTTLQPSAEPRGERHWHRRFFYLTPWDRYNDPTGRYATSEPIEAVDPREIQLR
jgi:hypothetical protein